MLSPTAVGGTDEDRHRIRRVATLNQLRLRGLLASAALFAAGCSLSLDFAGDCADNDDCAALGERMLCEGGACVEDTTPLTCVELLSNGCDDIYGPLESNSSSTVEQRVAAYLQDPGAYELISVHSPRSGFAASGQEIIEAAARVAIEDINKSGAFQEVETNGRKLAALVCDDGSGDVESGIAAARHAVECGAKAIIATQDSAPTVSIYTDVARALNVPVVSPGAISPAIPDIRTTVGQTENDDLLWRVRVPGNTTGRAVAASLKALRSDLVAAGAGDQLSSVVVFYRSGEQYGEAMFETFDGELCRGSFCEEVSVTAFAYDKPYGVLKDDIEAFLDDHGEVDLVVTLTAELFDLLDVLNGTAAAYPDEATAPDVLMVEGARSSLAVPTFVAGNQTRIPLACRAAGVSGASEGSKYETWLSLFRTAAVPYLTLGAGESVDSKLVAPTPAYHDAVTLTAFAMAAAALRHPEGVIDTPGLIGGLKRLSDTQAPTETAPIGSWDSGVAVLAANQGGGTMNYDGASGPIDLDPQSNDVRNGLTDLWRYVLNADAVSGLNPTTVVVETLGLLTSDGAGDAFEIDTALFGDLAQMRGGAICDGIAYRTLVVPAPAE